MSRLYINQTLEKSIRSYCELNDIEDVNAFANRCALQGFNVIKFGVSPKDNIERENNGIKDIVKNEKRKKNEKPQGTDDGKQIVEEGEVREEFKEEVEPIEEGKKPTVTVRKIRVIKKDSRNDD